MSRTRLQLDGLAELRAALRQLPDDLAGEANVIVTEQAQYAQQQIQAAYPEGPTGNLRRGVTYSKEGGTARFGARAVVRSRSPHSHLFEFGTKQRRTRSGANRGQMPVGPESERMIPIVIRRRQVMVSALKDLVRKAGFTVESGS